MKQGYRERCIKGVITGLLLFALQAGAFAQYEDTTVTVDTSTDAEVSVTTYDTEEQSPRQEAVPPQEPPVFRAVPDSVIRNLQKKKEFAYANDPAYWKKEPVSSDSNDWLAWLISKEWFKYMVLTLLIGVLLFAIIRIAISNRMFMFTAGRKSADREEDELLQQENLASLVQEAEAQNNFRLAVRYRYMKVLQEMDERKIIALDARSTNWDYVSRMGSHPLKNQFLLLTRAYEYVWYGEFEINNDQYGYLRTEFQQFENSLSR